MGFGAGPGAMCDPTSDLAVLFLPRMVGPAWAPIHTGGAGDSLQLHDGWVTNFHPLPTSAQIASLAVGNALTQIGYGPQGTTGTGNPMRRFNSNTVQALADLGGTPIIVPNTPRVVAGDSGGALLGPFGAATDRRPPPVGVLACGRGGTLAQGDYSGLNNPANLSWV